MVEITEIKLSKNTVNTEEQFKISVEIFETVDYPCDYPYDFPVAYTGIAEPIKQVLEKERSEVHENGTG